MCINCKDYECVLCISKIILTFAQPFRVKVRMLKNIHLGIF